MYKSRQYVILTSVVSVTVSMLRFSAGRFSFLYFLGNFSLVSLQDVACGQHQMTGKDRVRREEESVA